MNTGPVISNASPLIALAQIGHLDFLEQIYQEVVIPPAVAAEISASVSLPSWIEIRRLSQSVGPRILQASLGPDESETIALALEIDARLVILREHLEGLVSLLPAEPPRQTTAGKGYRGGFDLDRGRMAGARRQGAAKRILSRSSAESSKS